MATIATTFRLIDDVTPQLRNIQNSLKSTTSGFESFAGKLVAINSAMDIFSRVADGIKKVGSVFGSFVSDASEYESLLANLTVSIGDANEAQKEFQKLKEFASKTPFDLPGVVEASIMFRSIGMEADKILPTIKMLGDAAAGNNQYFKEMAVNYMQIQSIGKASAMDMKQFALRGLPVIQMMQEMGIEGQATAEQVEYMFQKMTSEGGKFYNSMETNSKTMAGGLSNFRDSLQQASATIGNSFLPSIHDIVVATSEFLNNIQQSNAFQRFVEKMTEGIKYIKDNLSSLIAVMIQVATVATMVGTTMAIAWAVANWPVSLIIIGITTIIRLLYDTAKQSNDTAMAMTGSFNQVSLSLANLGRIIGAIGATVGGLMDIIYNVVATIWNALLMVSEFIYNIFIHPIDAIAGLFIDLASTILQVFSSIAGIIDLIFGTQWTKALNSADRQLQEFKKNNLKTAQYTRPELKDISSIMSGIASGGATGYELGKYIDEAFSLNPQTNITSSLPALETPNFNFDNNGNLKVANQNELKISDEYKQLLADRAVQQYQLKYSQITPSFTIQNVQVSERADVDSIFSYMAEKMEELANSDLRR